MGRVSDSTKEHIRERIDMVQLVSEYVTLKQRGPDDFWGSVRAVVIEIEFALVRWVVGPAENGIGITPDEVRHFAIIIHDVKIGAVGVGREHPRVERAFTETPSMQKDETRAIGVEEQVIEIVAGL